METTGTSIAILIGVWATFALDVFSTLNSSPQTAEINIGRRQESLMYWVKIGFAVGVGGGLAATVISKKPWPLLAALSVSAGMWLLYRHAAARGLRRADEAGTEGY